MAVTSFFPIGCMIWQHAVILESLWETGLNITHFPVQRTGRLTPLLTCLLYFSLLLGQNYSKSNSLSPFLFLDKNFLSPTPLLSFLLEIIFQVQFLFSLLLDEIILSPTPIPQNFSKTILNSVLVAKQIQSCKISLRQF